METNRLDRRGLVRAAVLAVATGGASALAGCGDPDDDDGEDDGGGWGYREDEFDPGSENDAGTSAGGSSAG